MLDRKDIEDLVRQTLAELAPQRGSSAPPSGKVIASSGNVSVDTTHGGLEAPHDAAALSAMLAAQPARIAVGRAGTRLRTPTLLRFRADHAAARDAVQTEVDPELIKRLGFVELATRAEDKRHFLLRPDAGRALSDAGREAASRLPKNPRVQVIYGDGLSAAALNEHLEGFHQALVSELGKAGLSAGTPVFVRRSRVKVMDEIARITGAESAIFVCGERPGLGFADSMSVYYIYKPGEGATDANREVLSNVNPRGLPPAQAAIKVVETIGRILRDKRSGILPA